MLGAMVQYMVYGMLYKSPVSRFYFSMRGVGDGGLCRAPARVNKRGFEGLYYFHPFPP